MTNIRIRPATRARKPTAPRTCCPTHRDTCNFGRAHLWAGPFLRTDNTWSHPDDLLCSTCGGTCTADRPGPGQQETDQ